MSELVPIEQKEVDFYGDEVTAVRLGDGQVYASLRHMCNALGLDTVSQRRRIERHDLLNEGKGVVKVTTPGGIQETYVLLVDLVPLWLAGIQVKNVREDLRPKLAKFQKEAARVLWQAFQRGELTADFDIDALAEAGNASAQAYVMARAIMSLSYQQLAIEQQQKKHTAQLADHDRRLEALETAVSTPDRKISEAQAMEISQAVKAVAMLLSKQTRRNEYGGVYGEVYRRYNITGYKQLPLSKFGDCMGWLNEWRENLEGGAF